MVHSGDFNSRPLFTKAPAYPYDYWRVVWNESFKLNELNTFS